MVRNVLTVNDVPGFHRWEGATGSVSFLQHRHRHVFRIECEFEVSHNDREVEVFTRQDEIREFLKGRFGAPCEFGVMSCEDICEAILAEFADCAKVVTREDGHGGASLSR